MPSKMLNPDYIWDREKDTFTKIYKTKIDKWASKTQASLKQKLEKKEDSTTISFVTIIHKGDSDIGQSEAWERNTVISSEQYHHNHYLLMELARGYLNPRDSRWTKILSENLHNEDNEN
jgi:hypothetical protein